MWRICETYIGELREFAPSLRTDMMKFSVLDVNFEFARISLRQFIAWTWGRESSL
jgi:hypothetical protein